MQPTVYTPPLFTNFGLSLSSSFSRNSGPLSLPSFLLSLHVVAEPGVSFFFSLLPAACVFFGRPPPLTAKSLASRNFTGKYLPCPIVSSRLCFISSLPTGNFVKHNFRVSRGSQASTDTALANIQVVFNDGNIYFGDACETQP